MAWSGQSPEHDADHGESHKGGDRCGVAFEVASQPAVAADPGERPLDNPPFGQDLEAGGVGSLHDLQPPCPGTPGDERHLRTCVSAISKDTFNERKHPSRLAQHLEGAVTILNIGGMNDDAQQEAQRVDQDVPLAALDPLARVVA